MLSSLFEALSLFASFYRKVLIRAGSRNLSLGRGVRIYPGVILRTYDGGRIEIGPDTHIRPSCVIEAKGGTITIGANSLVNSGCCIVSTASISIGRDALIAEYVTIRDQDHAHDDPAGPFALQGRSDAPIQIGDNVWLAAKVTVTKGVSIGDAVVVGANAVVTRDLETGGRFAGVPARRMPSH